VRLADHIESSAAENEKTPAKAAVVGTSQGFQKQRLRSESNRRWRICNPLPFPAVSGENPRFECVDHAVDHSQSADPALRSVIEAWPRLPMAVRTGILAIIEGSLS
jgi:hypothetical protein